MRWMMVVAVAALVGAAPTMADEYVKGYIRSDGTYVQPHYRSSPDNSTWNNYSTQGNTNPYTGRAGTEDPYGYSLPEPVYQQREHKPYKAR